MSCFRNNININSLLWMIKTNKFGKWTQTFWPDCIYSNNNLPYILLTMLLTKYYRVLLKLWYHRQQKAMCTSMRHFLFCLFLHGKFDSWLVFSPGSDTMKLRHEKSYYELHYCTEHGTFSTGYQHASFKV